MTTQLDNPSINSVDERPYLKGILCQLHCICERLDRMEECVCADDSVYLKLRNALFDRDSWICCGRVKNWDDYAVENLAICLFDCDPGPDDDYLGSVRTDQNGEFCLIYRTSQFQDWYEEQYPDLYLVGRSLDNSQVFISSPVRFNAGQLERFYITLQRDGTFTIE